MTQLQHAQLHYNETGTPVSDLFDDVYFSNDNGLLETDYVFLQQNQLPERWFTHPRRYFHIFETGFGTGLNFLLTWQKFRQAQAAGASVDRLYFSSFEKYPLTPVDLAKALSAWPALAELSAQLVEQYPAAQPGPQRVVLDQGRVVLDLWLGDVNQLMPQVPLHNQADAWYLDGFAPSKNPDMWQDSLFQGMFRLSKAGCTVATFTSAGLVKRGLAAAGFNVSKIKGYGHKREMLTARHPVDDSAEAPTEKSVMVVGAGVAGLLTSFMLQRKGWSVQVVCADAEAGAGASHNRQGALYPNLHSQYDLMTALSSQSFSYASRFYPQLQQQLCFAADWCGVLQLACTPELMLRQQKIATRPSTLYRPLSAQAASEQAGVALPFAGLFFPQGGWISPKQLCQTLAAYLQQSGVQIHYQSRVLAIDGQQLHTETASYQAKHIVLATGAELKQLWPVDALPQRQVRGQVSHVEAPTMQPLKTVLCHKGYITPAFEGLHCVGATFDREEPNAVLKDSDNDANLALVDQVLQQPSWFRQVHLHSAKAGLRATVPDHLPLVGASHGLWTLGALAARGLTWGPLLADSLTALLCQEPVPLSLEQLQALHPNRFKGCADATDPGC